MCILAGLLLPCVPSKLCWPIFFSVRGNVPGPLFLQSNGQPLTCILLTNWLRQILSTAGNFSIHSFRCPWPPDPRSWAVGPLMLINSAFAHLLKLSRACPFASRVSPSFLKGVGPRGCCSLLVQSASHLGGGAYSASCSSCLRFSTYAWLSVSMPFSCFSPWGIWCVWYLVFLESEVPVSRPLLSGKYGRLFGWWPLAGLPWVPPFLATALPGSSNP